VALRERERSSSGLTSVRASRSFRLGQSDIEIDDRPPESLIPDGAPDDPGLVAGEQLVDELTNRRPPASSERDCC
jgi:hypothetical protein